MQRATLTPRSRGDTRATCEYAISRRIRERPPALRQRPLSRPASAWRLGLAFLFMPPVSALAAAAIYPSFHLRLAAPILGSFALMRAASRRCSSSDGALPAFLALKRRGPITSRKRCGRGRAGNVPGALSQSWPLSLRGAYCGRDNLPAPDPLPALLASTVTITLCRQRCRPPLCRGVLVRRR